MTWYYAIGSGNWTDGSKWSTTPAGHGAQAHPIAGDNAVITTGYSMTMSASAPVLSISLQGGSLTIAAGVTVTFTDAAGAGLGISPYNSGGLICQGTDENPVIFQSSNNPSTNQYIVMADAVSGADKRVIDYGVIQMKNVLTTLGYLTYFIYLNNPRFPTGRNSATIGNPAPLAREPIIIEHQIDGRATSRVYQRGGRAGTITLNGVCRWDSWVKDYLLGLQATGKHFSFTSEFVSIPLCRFQTRPSFKPKDGSLYLPFSITLIEDR